MTDYALENLAEVLTVIVELAFAVALTLVGLAAESIGLSRIAVGLDPLTLWYVAIGALALYAGVYVLGYQTVFARLRV